MMATVDERLGEVAAVLATLPPDHAELIRRHLAVPRWQARALRLAAQDQAIADARQVVAPGARPTQAAEALATELRRYLALDAWQAERNLAALPDAASSLRVALHRILQLNRGKALGWRRIYDVFEGVKP